jgi:hypothetical protein
MTSKQIIKKYNEICRRKMTIKSHGWTGSRCSIGEMAKKSARTFSQRARYSPALSLINVILAANRDYKKVVEPNIRRIASENKVNSFKQLKALMKRFTPQQFYKFWGHRDKKRYKRLRSVLAVISQKKRNYKIQDEFEAMFRWANETCLAERKNDVIG